MKKIELSEVLVKGMGKHVVDKLAAQANDDPVLYRELLDVLETQETTPAMKASWVLANAARLDKAPAQKHGSRFLQLLFNARIGGVQRELMKVLEVVELSDEEEGRFVDLCFQLLRQPGLDVGIRYYGLRILRQKVKKYPDLKPELITSLEEVLSWHNDVWKRHTSNAIVALKKPGRKK